jgi:hypothetical protein
MRPTITLRYATALLCAITFDHATIQAQPSEHLSFDAKEDRVQADLSTTATRHTREPLMRTSAHGKDGLYTVRIIDVRGQVRMTGTYADSTLVLSQGEFRYYYPNGGLESHGLFANGIKTGTWECFTALGASRADRYYHGMDWDDLQVFVGMSTHSCTGARTMTCGQIAVD